MKTLPCLLSLGLSFGLSMAAVPVHVVKTGDTLYSIARANELTPKNLAEWNQLEDRSTILIGQKLKLAPASPQSTAPTPAAPAKPTASYTVVKGDTFYSIAQRHRLSVTALKSLNPGIDETHIVVGQKLNTKPGSTPALVKNNPPKKSVAAPKQVAIKAVTPKAPTKKITSSTPTPTPVINKTPPVKKVEQAPVVASTKKETKTTEEEPKPTPDAVVTPPPSVKSIILTKETRFEDFASKYDISTKELNKLNGWNLPAGTILASGSEIFIPKG